MSRDELRLMEFCALMEQEKWDRAKFTALLDRMTALLGARLTQEQDRRRRLELIRLIDQMRQAASLFNVNPGHLAGWLCAAACQQ